MSDDLASLARTLGTVSAAKAVRPVMAKAGVQMKARMQAEAAGHRHAPALPAAISYSPILGGLGVEVGPRKGAAGSLGFYYFGNSKVNASIPDPVIGLRAEAETTRQFIANAMAAELLRRL